MASPIYFSIFAPSVAHEAPSIHTNIKQYKLCEWRGKEHQSTLYPHLPDACASHIFFENIIFREGKKCFFEEKKRVITTRHIPYTDSERTIHHTHTHTVYYPLASRRYILLKYNYTIYRAIAPCAKHYNILVKHTLNFFFQISLILSVCKINCKTIFLLFFILLIFYNPLGPLYIC